MMPSLARADATVPAAAAVPRGLRETATRVVAALARRDLRALAREASPDGTWFASGPTLGDGGRIRIHPPDFAHGLRSTARRRWGYRGSGGCDSDDCGELDRPRTLREYIDDVVYARDFARLPAAFVVADEYDASVAGPGAWEVSYRDPGSDDDYDWRILRLYFRERGGRWALTAIHNREWLI